MTITTISIQYHAGSPRMHNRPRKEIKDKTTRKTRSKTLFINRLHNCILKIPKNLQNIRIS